MSEAGNRTLMPQPTCLDFVFIATRPAKKGHRTEFYPLFKIMNPSKHLMIRGRDFYAIWIAETGLWSTNEQDAIDLIDSETKRVMQEHRDEYEDGVSAVYLKWSENGMIDIWHKYCQRQMRDSFHMLDEKIVFSNSNISVEDYASKKLPYALEKGDTTAWDRFMSVLYSPSERRKIEWAIGSIVSGDSREIQKFLVFYGAGGTGKSTILNIIADMFKGYTTTFNSKELGSSNAAFALEPFKNNPLVAIDTEGDLSRIEDNVKLNALVAHEPMVVNEKFKSTYAASFKCFLLLGTNRPVRITDAKSGIIRRLIDVSPTGDTLKRSEYDRLKKQVRLELGAIAKKCLDEYLDHPNEYDDYRPVKMLGASNDFYNFIIWPKAWDLFVQNDATTATAAWSLYKEYIDYAMLQHPYTFRPFKEELKNYFKEYYERYSMDDGTRARSYYKSFLKEKFEEEFEVKNPEPITTDTWINLKMQASIFDKEFADCPAQEANSEGTPPLKWINSKSLLKDIRTSRLHYMRPPVWLVVFDFDKKNDAGEKDLKLNIEAASKWPPTYTEVSKSGKALHLHYRYTGDPSLLSRILDDGAELKVFTGNSSLRRCLSLCNDLPIATISSGLPMKEVKRTFDKKQFQDEMDLRRLILRCMLPKTIEVDGKKIPNPERINPEGTKHSVDFICYLLNQAHDSGMHYDLRNMFQRVSDFAMSSSNHKSECLTKVNNAPFCSEDIQAEIEQEEHKQMLEQMPDKAKNIFYDIEVYPNYCGINWKEEEDYTPKDFDSWEKYVEKLQVDHKPIHWMINPTSAQVEEFLDQYGDQLIDFNGLRYDRHIIKGRLMGFKEEQTYRQSKAIVEGDPNAMDREARSIGRLDLYECASAANKKSLKKLEIEMGFHHDEIEFPFDEPVPQDQWKRVAAYCDNDVLATEAGYHWLQADVTSRRFLADITGCTINNTTNQLTARFIFGNDRSPQSHFLYRNLAEPVRDLPPDVLEFIKSVAPGMIPFDQNSLLPYFPGYKKERGVSTYRGEVVGEGGYVYAEPGAWGRVALLDVRSMHPTSTRDECLFGPEHTKNFSDILDSRVLIKHKDWDNIGKVLDGKLAPYAKRVQNGEISAKSLSNALKTAINSVYGLTSASFPNPFKDPRNTDNIVAKRGALFMIDLKNAVQEKGFKVAHIKTDSIKIPDATPEIIQFVMDFGRHYGYEFEHEATYDKMCLVNDAVYIAKYDTAEHCQEMYGYCPSDNKEHPGEWTATGKQFAVPYVFKTLFSHEPIVFNDLCEVFSVNGALYLDMNESLPDVSQDEKLLAKYAKEGRPMEDRKELLDRIEKGHSYHFVGRVGQFTPVKPGTGGGILLRKADDRYSAATGSKGCRWMESEMVRKLELYDDVDRGYYDKLVNDAVEAISKYTDFEWFVSDDRYDVPPEG